MCKLFFESRGKSATELLALHHAKLNECIKEVNSFTSSINLKMETFTKEIDDLLNVYKTSYRQEFQDFIDVIDLKLKSTNLEFETVKLKIIEIEKSVENLTNEIKNFKPDIDLSNFYTKEETKQYIDDYINSALGGDY
jgi:uncharacterized protein Yka (UPF0111/DUF47 family)